MLVVIAGALALTVAGSRWLKSSRIEPKESATSETASIPPTSKEELAAPSRAVEPDKPANEVESAPPGTEVTAAAPQNPHRAAPNPAAGSFLDQFMTAGAEATPAEPGRVKNDPELEAEFQAVTDGMEKRGALSKQLSELMREGDAVAVTNLRAEIQQLVGELNEKMAQFDKDLSAVRAARPKDPVAQWLTGELLQYAGGDPASTFPYFENAANSGVQRPRLFASLARAQFDQNRFDEAYDSAVKAFELGGEGRFYWDTYSRIALGNERFDDLKRRLEARFPDGLPDWAASVAERDSNLTALWRVEQDLRKKEAAADDLPRVRLTIRHRRYVRDANGSSTTEIESTGEGDLVVELFEDQAPETVANFISLVESGFYDGTLFSTAEGGSFVVGGLDRAQGDTRNEGPGYAIADEYDRPDARPHFRGTLSLVNQGPNTAASEFFITLAPFEALNGRMTAFGRIVKGQETADAITLGHATSDPMDIRPVIPGDELVHAEVIRKRPHPYSFTRLPEPSPAG